jgi:hypothetical protein
MAEIAEEMHRTLNDLVHGGPSCLRRNDAAGQSRNRDELRLLRDLRVRVYIRRREH